MPNRPLKLENVQRWVESLAGAKWLSAQHDHHRLKQLHYAGEGLRSISMRTTPAQEIARSAIAALDLLAFTRLCDVTWGAFDSANTSGPGSDVVRQRIDRLKCEKGYYGAFLELWAASNLYLRGWRVRPHNANRHRKSPDWRIEDDRGQCHAHLECKNNRQWTSNTILADVKKANRQLRELQHSAPAPGFVVIGLLGSESALATHVKAQWREDIVAASMELVRRLNSGRYRAVTRVYLVWDEVIRRAPDLVGGCPLTAYRRVAVFTNPHCQYSAASGLLPFNPESISYRHRDSTLRGIVQCDWLIGKNRTITPSELDAANAALRNLAHFEFRRISEDCELIYCTGSRQTDRGCRIDLLVLHRERDHARFMWGLSLPRSVLPETLAVSEPRTMLQFVADKYGLVIETEDRAEMLLEGLIFCKRQKTPTDLLKIKVPDGRDFDDCRLTMQTSVFGIGTQTMGPASDLLVAVDFAMAVDTVQVRSLGARGLGQ